MASKSPWAKYRPDLDIAQFQPHSADIDLRQMSHDERSRFMRALVELYFLNLQQWPVRRRNFNWFTYGYVAQDYTFLYGLTNPRDDPSVGETKSMGEELGGNQIASERTYRGGFLPVQGSLVVIPNESGAYFRFPFSGTDMNGETDFYWETNYIVVDDGGKITHFEVWADTQVFKTLSKKVYGIDTDGPAGKDLAAYLEAGWDKVTDSASSQ